jgi:hypothetical protein
MRPAVTLWRAIWPHLSLLQDRWLGERADIFCVLCAFCLVVRCVEQPGKRICRVDPATCPQELESEFDECAAKAQPLVLKQAATWHNCACLKGWTYKWVATLAGLEFSRARMTAWTIHTCLALRWHATHLSATHPFLQVW